MATLREQLAEQAEQIAALREEVARLSKQAFTLRTIEEMIVSMATAPRTAPHPRHRHLRAVGEDR